MSTVGTPEKQRNSETLDLAIKQIYKPYVAETFQRWRGMCCYDLWRVSRIRNKCHCPLKPVK